MMGSRRPNEKDQSPPTSSNPLIQANRIAPIIQSTRSTTFQEGNISTGSFDSFRDSSLLITPSWDNMYSINRPITQGIPETSGNPISYLMNPSSIQNPQINLNSSTPNTNVTEVPFLPEWNTRWNPQFLNQGHNTISTPARHFTGDLQMNRQTVDSKFGHFNRPQLDADFVHATTIHTRNNFNLNTSQCGAQGKVEGSFLSLGIGSNEESIPNKLKEAASNELKLARARKAMSQTLDSNFTINGFSNQFDHMNRNDIGVHCTSNSGHDNSNSNFPSTTNYYRAFVGNQGVHSGTVTGNCNSTQFLNPQHYGNHTPSEQLQNIRFKTANTLPSVNSSLKLGSSSTRQNYPSRIDGGRVSYALNSHKRSAVAPPSGPHWVQRQKITHPNINHHSMPIQFPAKPGIPVTATQPHTRDVTAPITSSPSIQKIKPRVPVTSPHVVSHVTWKDPDTTPELIKYKCLLCKRSLSLTSEGAVYQPTAPPPVAVLPCGHTFHDQCLQKITPQDQAKDPPCIPCAIGEN